MSRMYRILKAAAASAAFIVCVGAALADDDVSEMSLTGVGVNVADLARAEKFYIEVFGMERVFRYPAEGKLMEVGLSLPGRPGMLILAHFNDDPLPDEKSAYGRIVINTPDAKAVAKLATDRGSTANVVAEGAGVATIIFMDDPDGYQIELYQPAGP